MLVTPFKKVCRAICLNLRKLSFIFHDYRRFFCNRYTPILFQLVQQCVNMFQCIVYTQHVKLKGYRQSIVVRKHTFLGLFQKLAKLNRTQSVCARSNPGASQTQHRFGTLFVSLVYCKKSVGQQQLFNASIKICNKPRK